MKLACVIQRFGPEIAGGSERHCRVIAEHLAAEHDVTILTTCAQDYVTWRNVYAAGASTLGALRVLRFPVARQRRMHRFAEISEIVFTTRSSPAEQELWFRENGPDAPELLEYLRQHGREYDRVLFWSYRYSDAYFGLPLVADRAVLVPTAEEDPLIRVDVLDQLSSGCRQPGMFLTPEEEELVALRCATPLPPSCIIGCGVEPRAARRRRGRSLAARHRQPFVLYLGRIERNKGCETLLEYFERYLERGGAPVQLVLAGPANMPLPEHPLVKRLGVVDDAMRDALMARHACSSCRRRSRASAWCCSRRGTTGCRRSSTDTAAC